MTISTPLSFQVEVIEGPDVYNSLTTVYYRNQFDELGSLLSLQRLKDEKNYEYKRRIQNAAVYTSNSTYQGLINGITRELGLSLFNAITVNPKVNGSQEFVADDPYIKFDGAYLYLYSDYANNELACTIDRFQQGGNYEHLTSLVNIINQTSSFEASLVTGIDPYTRSMTILNQSNRNIVKLELIPLSTKFKLNNKHVSKCFFSNRSTFRTEVVAEALVLNPGEYYINYSKGIVTVFNMPNKNEYAKYEYTQYPFTAIASPVILHDINKESFKVKMFSQILQDDGSYAHGLPTEIGTDIINELISVTPMYYGI